MGDAEGGTIEEAPLKTEAELLQQQLDDGTLEVIHISLIKSHGD